MRYLALFVIPVAIVLASPVRSQQDVSEPVATAKPVASPVVAHAAPPMTPAQSAEFHGDVLMARKEYAAAIEMYGAALKFNPNNAAVLNKTGIAYQQMDGFNTAIDYYKRAARADKKLFNPLNNLGTVEYQQHHYSKAVGYYKRAIAMGAASAPLYTNLGYTYFATKKYKLAMESFGKALAIDPTVFDHHDGTGGATLQQRSSTDPATFNFFMAKTYAKSGDAEKAARYLKLARDYGYKIRAAAKDPDFAAVLKDPRVQDVLQNRPSFAGDEDAKAPVAN